MNTECFGNYFLILLLIVFFMLLYVYVGDNVRVVKPEREAFSTEHDKNTLVPLDKVAYIQGNGVPDKPFNKIVFDQTDPSMNSVDGSDGTPKSMFMFAYNKCDPKCCGHSPFSCSGGCVCLTEEQKRFMSNRGYNNKYNKCYTDEF
jgi:hypothetical protein